VTDWHSEALSKYSHANIKGYSRRYKTCFSSLQIIAKVALSSKHRRYVMKFYNEFKAEIETIQQQMAEAKKSERANVLKEVKELCKEFGFTAGRMLKGSLAEGRKSK